MSFTNVTPDLNPDGTRFSTGTTQFGVRYFYFTFVPSSASVSVFLARNIYRNEETITRIFTPLSPISLLNISNVSNVTLPCTLINGQIGLFTPSGSTYQNISNIPNFKLNKLVIGNTYILESRTIYNDPGMDFGVIIKDLTNKIISLTYVQASLLPITPTLPIPLPPMPMPPMPMPPMPVPPPPSGLPPVPSMLAASSVTTGVYLTWNVTPQTTSYIIYREGLLLSSSMTPNYVDTQVISGNSYKYRVSAVNLIGEGEQSSAITFKPIFSFTNMVPNITPTGSNIADSNTRFYYFLFTPITSAVDVFCYNNKTANQKAIIGIYDTSDPTINLFTSSNISQLDSNVAFSSFMVGSVNINGLRVITDGSYTNPGLTPNFRINLPALDLTTSAAVLKTYIFEIVSYKNSADTFSSDFGIYFKNVGSNSLTTRLIYNSVNILRVNPSPYIITYDFTKTTDINYTNYILPNIVVFQNVKNVLESIITTTHNARAANRTNDMLVNFTISQLTANTLGVSSVDNWTADSTRTPDFTYEQSITLNSDYFTNGYMISSANFNGSNTVNNLPNISLFNVLLHEMIHGLGFFYSESYNTSYANIGWNPFLTNVSDNTPWYKGPIGSAALSSYNNYFNSTILQRIPVESNYGSGTAQSHWAQGDTPTITNDYRYFNGVYCPALKYELMTGFIKKNDYMTGATSGMLKDYGYNVNLVSPYVVSHPFVSLMPMIDPEEPVVKCSCMSIENKTVHKLILEDPHKPVPTQTPSYITRAIFPVGFVRPLFPVYYFTYYG